MKWKDTMNEKEEKNEKSNPYYEDDGYASYTDKELKSPSGLTASSAATKKWGIIIGCSIAVVIAFIILSKLASPGNSNRLVELEQRIEQLEMRSDKFYGVDEKVTRIWEQAKSFETFKTRFDRSEASISLRMDHISMSLDALQKKTDKNVATIKKMEKVQAKKRVSSKPAKAKKTAIAKTYIVAPGDTLYKISRRYNLSVDELKAINKLKTGAVIHVGQVLIVSRTGN